MRVRRPYDWRWDAMHPSLEYEVALCVYDHGEAERSDIVALLGPRGVDAAIRRLIRRGEIEVVRTRRHRGLRRNVYAPTERAAGDFEDEAQEWMLTPTQTLMGRAQRALSMNAEGLAHSFGLAERSRVEVKVETVRCIYVSPNVLGPDDDDETPQ